VPPFQLFVTALCSWIVRERDGVIAFLREENRVLRAHLRGRRLQLSDEERRRLAVVGHQLGRAALAQVATIATADTILRWHRELTARRCLQPPRRSGRLRVEAAVRSLIRRMATENATWGYTRIQGALKNLGHRVGRSTIARILREQGIPPSGRRPMAWRTFIGAHWPALLASDLFTSVVGALRRSVIHSMALLTELPTRRTAVRLAMAPGQRLSASGDADVHEQVHRVVAITQLDSYAAPRGQPLVRAAGSPRRASRPQTEQPRLNRPVRRVDEGKSLNRRRASSAAQTPAGTRGTVDAVPWRARSPTAPERVDRIFAHAASSSGVPWLASPIVSSYAA
jgi:hypothetical protein